MSWRKKSWQRNDSGGLEPAYLGNGRMGMRVGEKPLTDGRLILGDLWGHLEAEDILQVIEVPSPLSFEVHFARQWKGYTSSLRGMTLDYSSGTLDAIGELRAPSGAGCRFETRHWISRAIPCLAVLDLALTPEQSGPLYVQPCMGDQATVAVRTRPDARVPAQYGGLAESRLCWRGRQTNELAAFNLVLREAEGATLLHASSGFGTGSDVWVAHWEDVAAGQTVRLRIYMTCVTSREHAQPMAQAVRMRRWAFSHEHEELTTAHQRSWDQVWRGRVRVCGDDEAQAALDGSLYHLASSASAHSRGGMAPFGLSSDAYKGHVFWDCDLWTYPPFVLLDPAAARAILGYRLRGVPAARAYASMYGCEGLMFPWEAAGDGQESTVVRAMTGIQQHHITPDVAFAFWQYQIANGDDDWMREATWPVLKGVASWIVSRVESSSRGYEIRHVIAPDEFSQNVHNNAFTNLACRRVLQFAMDCAARVGQTPPRIWKRVAEGLVIPRNENGWILQQDGWTGERKAKQADTLLAVYPFDALERPEDIANVLAQHVPQNPDHRYTVAMGDQIHAVVAARMGRRDDAALFFRRAWEPYWIQPWGMYAETAERRSGCFVTGHGGLLQAALTGFTGLQLEDPALAVHDTALPAHWTRIECDRIWWRGEAYHLSAEHGRKASLTPIDC